jgi:hypothetical protein
VGWHLRFSRVDLLEALMDARAVGQVYNHVAPDQGWRIEAAANGDGTSLVTLRRIDPLYSVEDD